MLTIKSFPFYFAEFFSFWAPQFLQPVLVEIILAGKSMEMLQDLGKLAEVVGHKGDISMNSSMTSFIVYINATVIKLTIYFNSHMHVD